MMPGTPPAPLCGRRFPGLTQVLQDCFFNSPAVMQAVDWRISRFALMLPPRKLIVFQS
jgi:hypothetical protein